LGKDRWKTADFVAADKDLKAKNVDAFDYSRKALSRSDSTLSEWMDPSKRGLCESKDPDQGEGAGKQTVSISIGIDVTGSGQTTPRILREDLPQLMELVTDPLYIGENGWANVQIAGIGDVTSDRFGVQISNFESGLRVDERGLREVIMEGGGGGSKHESYELYLWYAKNRNRLDSWKRGQKGFMFIIGDEMPYETIRAKALYEYMGNPLGQERYVDTSLSSLMPGLKSLYQIYYIICKTASWFGDAEVTNYWRNLIGAQNVIELHRPQDISELIASIIGFQVGHMPIDQISSNLLSLGAGNATVNSIEKALVNIVPESLTGSALNPYTGEGSKRIGRL